MFVVTLAAGTAAPETMTYDGELFDAGIPAHGLFNFQFRCFSGPEPDVHDQIGLTLVRNGVEVRRGWFTVQLDFCPGDRCLSSGWLETAVARADRIGGFTRLEPLQSVSSSPSRGVPQEVPSGAVMFFDRSQCPDGWTEYVAARGRAIVGLVYGGTVGGTVGAPLSDLEQRSHGHQVNQFYVDTDPGGRHNHIWSTIQSAGGDIQWSSYDASGNPVLAFSWGNGIGNEGSGIYPMAAQPNATFYTIQDGTHSHEVFVPTFATSSEPSLVPYVQLLVCQKD
jgi:hypothetical protein